MKSFLCYRVLEGSRVAMWAFILSGLGFQDSGFMDCGVFGV